MPWVRFIADFDFKPKESVTVAFKAGTLRIVPRAAAAQAVAEGKAEAAERPPGRPTNGT